MNMDDLLKALGESGGAQGSGSSEGGDPLADLLGGILGGGGQQAGGGGMGDLLEGLIGGGQPSRGGSGGGDLGGLLEGILGGGSQQGGGDVMGILGSILGGGSKSSRAGTDSPMAPMIQGLAEKLGLPPEIAQLVVAFVLGKLFGGQGTQQTTRAPQPQAGGLNLDNLLERMGSQQGVDADYVRSTGLVDELSQQTGMDQETATRSLQEVLGMLGGQMGASGAPQQPRSQGQQGLDSLLDEWK